MSLRTDILHELAAKNLEPVLRAAIKSGDPTILEFCREHLYPVYTDHLGEAFNSRAEDPEIKRIFSAPAGILPPVPEEGA